MLAHFFICSAGTSSCLGLKINRASGPDTNVYSCYTGLQFFGTFLSSIFSVWTTCITVQVIIHKLIIDCYYCTILGQHRYFLRSHHLDSVDIEKIVTCYMQQTKQCLVWYSSIFFSPNIFRFNSDTIYSRRGIAAHSMK